MDLSNLPKKLGIRSRKKRLGRGYGSGKGGHTTGAGAKGQKVRGSGNIPIGFEGGQVPLFRKMPKLHGFKNHAAKKYEIIPLVKLNVFSDGDKVSPKSLVEKGMIKKIPKDGVKILSNGRLYKKLELSGFLYTNGSKENIEKSGSKIVE